MPTLTCACNGASDLRRYFLSLVILTIFILSGCSVGDFVGAYFNTYYNAQRQFDEAEAEILNAPALPGSRAEKEFLAPFDVTSQAKTKFTAVIEKCSKLLQYHPESKLVDDALFMIGKSYYYQNEHQSAERKFNELISTHPESDLLFEARLLLANTYYRSNNKEVAATAARALIEEAKAADEDGIVAKAASLLAHIEIEQKNLTDAIEHYRIASDLAESSVERAAAYRALAELYNQHTEYANAVDAYTKAEDVSTDYLGKYKAEIGQARSLSKLGKHEESLTLLESLIKNANYREFFGEVDLEIGNVYRDMNDLPSAEEQYRYVDTAYARTEAAANSYYQLGLLYERELLLYDSARVAYDKGKSEFPQAEVTTTLVKKSDYMAKYFAYKTEIAKYDSIRKFILYPPDTLVAIAGDSSNVDTSGILAQRDSLQGDSTVTVARTDSLVVKAPVIPPPPMDTVQTRLAFNKSELASLFYSGLSVIDSAKYWYQQLLSDHASSIYAPRAMYTLAEILGQDSTVDSARVDSLRRQIVDRFPESEFAVEARRLLGLPQQKKQTNPQIAVYDSADRLVKSGEIANALGLFRNIADGDSTSQLAAKAQYAVGWIFENVRPDNDSTVANYQRLVARFPNSQYASLVRPKLAEVESQRQIRIQEQKLLEQKKDSTAAPSDSLQPNINTGVNPGNVQPVVPDTGAVKDTLIVPPPPEGIKEDEENPKP